MSKKHRFTNEQFQQAESWAIEALNDVSKDDVTPVTALYMFGLCLFGIEQGTNEPKFTDKEMNDIGVYALEHYQLSDKFPYSNEQITTEIVRLKGGK